MAAVEMWRSELLAALPWCASGVSQRTGGVSAAQFASLNLGLHVGDDPDAVVTNRAIAAERLGFKLDDLVCAAQIHGGVSAAVDRAERGRGAVAFDGALPGVDALVTDAPGMLLTLFFADCVPVLLADRKRRAIGVAHAGWRGTVASIVENTVELMGRQFGSEPDDLVAAVGPAIGACCFEVGAEVAGAFPTQFVSALADRPKFHVDLKAAVGSRLRALGIPAEQITGSPECTSCEPDRYFSHRRDAGRSGRMAAMIGIIP